jgi:hypothetical protein
MVIHQIVRNDKTYYLLKDRSTKDIFIYYLYPDPTKENYEREYIILKRLHDLVFDVILADKNCNEKEKITQIDLNKFVRKSDRKWDIGRVYRKHTFIWEDENGNVIDNTYDDVNQSAFVTLFLNSS